MVRDTAGRIAADGARRAVAGDPGAVRAELARTGTGHRHQFVVPVAVLRGPQPPTLDLGGRPVPPGAARSPSAARTLGAGLPAPTGAATGPPEGRRPQRSPARRRRLHRAAGRTRRGPGEPGRRTRGGDRRDGRGREDLPGRPSGPPVGSRVRRWPALPGSARLHPGSRTAGAGGRSTDVAGRSRGPGAGRIGRAGGAGSALAGRIGRSPGPGAAGQRGHRRAGPAVAAGCRSQRGSDHQPQPARRTRPASRPSRWRYSTTPTGSSSCGRRAARATG